MDKDRPEILRPESVAKLLDVTPRTLRRLVATGKFPPAAMSLGGKLKWWRRETVAAWIEQHCPAEVDCDHSKAGA